MISIQKTGFWIFGETRVKTDDGKTHTFARDVDVKVSERGVCVTERGLVSSQTTCFIDAPRSQPDGTIAGNAKSVAVTTSNGGTSTYESSGISPTRVEKRGSEIVVVEQGVRGARVVATHAAANVTSVTGSTCSVCESLNPLYYRNDTARPQKG